MCYDIYGRLSGTCGCDRPPPKIIDHGCSTLYIYPVWKYDPTTGEGYWTYPEMYDYEEPKEIEINIIWDCFD